MFHDGADVITSHFNSSSLFFILLLLMVIFVIIRPVGDNFPLIPTAAVPVAHGIGCVIGHAVAGITVNSPHRVLFCVGLYLS